MIKRGMQHWNGCMVVAISLDITTADPAHCDIITVAMVILDTNLEPLRGVQPFNITMVPENLEFTATDKITAKKKDLLRAIETGFGQETAASLFYDWVVRLGLPMTKYGKERCKLIPLAHDYRRFQQPLRNWLTPEVYDEVFSDKIRDTLVVAQYLNDRAAMHGHKVPYSRTSLGYLGAHYHVRERPGDEAIGACVSTAQLYRAMTREGVVI